MNDGQHHQTRRSLEQAHDETNLDAESPANAPNTIIRTSCRAIVPAGTQFEDSFAIKEWIASENHADVYTVECRRSGKWEATSQYEARVFDMEAIHPSHRRYRLRSMKRLAGRAVLNTTWSGCKVIFYKSSSVDPQDSRATEQTVSTRERSDIGIDVLDVMASLDSLSVQPVPNHDKTPQGMSHPGAHIGVSGNVDNTFTGTSSPLPGPLFRFYREYQSIAPGSYGSREIMKPGHDLLGKVANSHAALPAPPSMAQLSSVPEQAVATLAKQQSPWPSSTGGPRPLSKSELKSSAQQERRRLQQKVRRRAKRRKSSEETAAMRYKDTLLKMGILLLEACEALSRAEVLSAAKSDAHPLGAWQALRYSDETRQKVSQGRLAADDTRQILSTLLAGEMKEKPGLCWTVSLGKAIIRSRASWEEVYRAWAEAWFGTWVDAYEGRGDTDESAIKNERCMFSLETAWYDVQRLWREVGQLWELEVCQFEGSVEQDISTNGDKGNK
jgi:hypothetical protein